MTMVIRALARKEKNSVLCMNWEIRCSSGSGCTVGPSMGSEETRGQKVTTFSLKLACVAR